MNTSMASLRKLVLLGLVSFAGLTQAQNTCNLWQVCAEHSDLTPGTLPTGLCYDAHEVTLPVFVEGGFAPTPMSAFGTSSLSSACPFYDPETPLCCNSDTAAIMGKLFLFANLTLPQQSSTTSNWMVFSQRTAQFALPTSSACGVSMPATLPKVISVSSPATVSLIAL